MEIIKIMNILISGIGGPTPLGVAKSLKLGNQNLRIIGIDANSFAPGHFDPSYDKTYTVPKASDESYWPAIFNIVKVEEIDFAFIIPETEVIEWSKKKLEGMLPCNALLPDYNAACFLFDKLKVSNILEPFNLAPKTIAVNSSINFIECLSDLDFPFWVRINKTAGALGAMKISSSEDLNNWLKIHNNDEFIASTFLPGRNYAAKLFFHNSNVILTASAERIEYLMPNLSPTKITGMCAKGRLLNRPDLIEKSEKAIREIYNYLKIPNINGVFTVDYKEDINNNPLITEINIRPVSFVLAFTLGGANFPMKMLQVLNNSNLSYNRLDFNFSKEFYFIRGVDFPIKLLNFE